MLLLDPSRFLAETLKPYATGVKAGLPGLFERYLLEPTDTDDAAITARMGEVKAIWDKSLEHSRYGRLAKSLAGEHDDAGLALLDPTERSRLASEFKLAAAEEQEKATAVLGDWRKLLADHLAKGGLTPNSRSMLERTAKNAGLPPQLVQAELAKAPEAALPKILDDDVRVQVRNSLQELARVVGEERRALSLYHGLGLDGITADVTEVQRQYAAVDEQNRARSLGQTAAAYKTVLANVKLYLLDSDPRAYIEGLFVDVGRMMELDGARAGTDGVVDPTEAESLLQTALRLGLTPELGRRLVSDLARQNDAVVETGAVVDYVSCPACNTPHPRPTAPQACKRCGTALFVECPSGGCGARNDATAVRCSNCNTDLHRYTDATRRLRALPEAIDAGRIGWAAAEIEEITGVLGAASVPADLRLRVEVLTRNAEASWTAVESALAARHLFAARLALRGLLRTASDLPGPTGDRPATRAQQVEQRLAEVVAALARARSATPADRETALVEAVRLAEDCEEAITALAAIPPQPPGAVDLELGAAGPVVRWAPSRSGAARYRVRRIEVRTGDAVDVASGEHTKYEDRDAPVGAVLCYEVTTLRGRAASSGVRSAALLVAREVQDLVVADADGEVRLSWKAVPASARVVVRRTAEGTGATLDLMADRTGVVNRAVTNGERYEYRVVVAYGGLGSDVQRTAGVMIHGQPASPPEGIESLRIRSVPGGVLIDLDRPAAGTVSIVRCANEPPVSHGDRVDPSGLAGYGRVLSVGADGARDAAASGVCWYLPVTVAGGTAVAGRATRHLALSDIKNVTGLETPGQLRLTWEWPADVRIAKVVWRHDRQPSGPDEPGAESAWVRLGEYRDNGGFTIDTGGQASVFVAVVPAIRADGDLVAGTSIAKSSRLSVTSAQKADLRYLVRRAGMRKKRLEVEVSAPNGVTPPSLVLVARSGDLLPRTAAEGDVLARLGGGAPLVSSIDISRRARPLAVRLFLESASSAASFQLFDPGADDLLIR